MVEESTFLIVNQRGYLMSSISVVGLGSMASALEVVR
jgi:hypothetical protein